ncbi:MAG: HD domain-containing protein [Bacteriovoracaceae bacterium]
MEIRDPVHGSIKIQDEEARILEHPFFQRLRNIKQLGFSEFVFPGATHTRYLHSIGVMEVVTRVFDQVFNDRPQNTDWQRLRETVRLACLLHDIGHAPLSHTTEFVMPKVEELKLPKPFAPKESRQASHEDYTIKSIVDSSFTDSFKDVIRRFGVDPFQIAALIIGEHSDSEYFSIDGINYFPLLHQLVSSEMDCDRMDYLLRDSYFCGVSYGKFDLDWIIDNLREAVVDKQAYLGISERAISTFDDFLLCRFHMFLMVYFHYKAVCLEKMLGRYFSTSNSEYLIPANIEEYLEHDDHFLMKTLRGSQNEWANKVIRNNIPPKIFETFGAEQLKTLGQIESYLKSNKIDYIKCSSSGRLSKYYMQGQEGANKYPIKVVREQPILKGRNFIQNITEATDLFEKFSKAHSVNRIHCEFDKLSESSKKDIRELANSL